MCRRTSLGPSRSAKLTNLKWVHISILLYLSPRHPLRSPLRLGSPFQRMLPKWRLGERRYSPDCRDKMRGSLYFKKRGGERQEVARASVSSSTLPPPFIFPSFLWSDLMWKSQIGPSPLPPVYITELIKERRVIKKWWSEGGLWQEKLILFNKREGRREKQELQKRSSEKRLGSEGAATERRAHWLFTFTDGLRKHRTVFWGFGHAQIFIFQPLITQNKTFSFPLACLLWPTYGPWGCPRQ